MLRSVAFSPRDTTALIPLTTFSFSLSLFLQRKHRKVENRMNERRKRRVFLPFDPLRWQLVRGP